MDTAQAVTIDFQPGPLPVANDLGAPAITLVSPLDGAAVPSAFDAQVQTTNFVPADQDVVVTLTNSGASEHDFSITDHENANVANLNISVIVAAGESTTVTINAPAGDYYFFCNIPGHEAAGMSGTLHVQ